MEKDGCTRSNGGIVVGAWGCFFLMIRRPPCSTLVPDPSAFRSRAVCIVVSSCGHCGVELFALWCRAVCIMAEGYAP